MKTAIGGSARTAHEMRTFCETLEDRVLLSAAWGGANYWAALHSQNSVAQSAGLKTAAKSSGLHARAADVAAAPVQNGGDVSQQIVVTRGGYRFDRAENAFLQTVTLRNATSTAIAGPLVLHLDLAQTSSTSPFSSPSDQAYLVKIKNMNTAAGAPKFIDLTKLLITNDLSPSTAQVQTDNEFVSHALKHIIVIKPALDLFQAGETVTLTLGFRNAPFNMNQGVGFDPTALATGFQAQQTPAISYITSVEQLPSNQLQYQLLANGASTSDANNVAVATQQSNTAVRSLLTITNPSGSLAVRVPDLAVAPDYGNFPVGQAVVFPTPDPFPGATGVSFTTTPADGPIGGFDQLRRIAASTTPGSADVLVSLQNAVSLVPGEPVSGAQIVPGTTILSIAPNANPALATVTLSQNVTAASPDDALIFGVVAVTKSLTTASGSSFATVNGPNGTTGLAVGQSVVSANFIGPRIIQVINGNTLTLSGTANSDGTDVNASFGVRIPGVSQHPQRDQLVAIIPTLSIGTADLVSKDGITYITAMPAPYVAYLYKFSIPASNDLLPGGMKVVLDLFQQTTTGPGSPSASSGLTKVWRKK